MPSISEATDYNITYDRETGREVYKKVSSDDKRWYGLLEIDQTLPWGANLSISSSLCRSTWFNDRLVFGEDTTEYFMRRRASLTQPLLAGNPVGRKYKTGKLAWKSSLIDHELKLRHIRYRATQLFFDLVSATWMLDISAQDLEQGQTSEELARRKLQAGLVPEVELLQIQVDVARREGNYREAEGSVEAAADRLRAELGLPFDQPVAVSWSPRELTRSGEFHGDISGERPELTKERYSLHQQELETKAAALSERIRASLQLFYELDNRNNDLDLLDEPGDRNTGIVLHFEVPIFGFGSTRGRIERLRADLARTRIELASREAELVVELREALRTIKRAEEKIRIAEAALELSLKSYDITEERFESGLVDSRALIDAQLDLTRTRTELLNSRIDYELALANLERIAPQ